MSGPLHLLRPYTEWRVKEYTRDAAAAYVAELRKRSGAGMEFGTLTSRRPNRAEELVGGSVYFCKNGVTLFRMPFLRLHPSAYHVWVLMRPEVYYVASRHVGMVRAGATSWMPTSRRTSTASTAPSPRRGCPAISARPGLSDVPWVAWPGLLKDVARVAGNGAAFRLAMELGGTEIHVPKAAYLRNEPDHPIVEAIGVTAACKVASEVCQGESIYVPRARRLCVQVLKERGASNREVAIRLRVYMRTVRRHSRPG